MQVAQKHEAPSAEPSVNYTTTSTVNSAPKIYSSPNTLSIKSTLPPLGKQQEYFAFGEGSKLFADSELVDRSLQKWAWIFAGLALASCATMGIAIWQFSGGI